MRLRAGLLVLCLFTFLWGLWGSAIQDFDEAFYAEAAREMVASGDWTTPHYNFEPRLQKPILYYWLAAATYEVAGVTEAAARFWSALAGLGLALIAFEIGRRWYDERTGAIAGAIVATSFGLVPIARQSLPDVPLAFFVTATIWAGMEIVRRGGGTATRSVPPRPAPARGLAAAGAVAMALGTLTKGPVAIVLPVIVLAPVIGWHLRRAVGAGDRFRLPLDLSSVGIAVALFVLVAVPWYVAVTRAQGLGYLQQFFVGENIDRFATSRYNSWRGWEYIGVVVGGLLPWSLFGVLWIRPAAQVLRRRRALAPVEVSLLCWAIAPLLFFFVSVGSQARYVLPCLVPLAVLLGRALAVHTRRASPLVTWAGVAAGAVVGGAGLLLMRARPLLGAADPDWTAAGPIVIVLCGLGIAAAAWWLPRRMLPVIVALSAALAIVAFERTTLMPGRPEPVERIAALARAQNLPGPICACGAFARNLSFYSHVPTVVANTRETDAEVIAFLSRPDRVLAAVDSSVLTGVEEQMHRRFERLGEVTYLNTSIWSQRPATLLHPDRSALQRVVLVRNR